MKGGDYMDMQDIISMLKDVVIIGTNIVMVIYYINCIYASKNHSSGSKQSGNVISYFQFAELLLYDQIDYSSLFQCELNNKK